MQISHDYSVEDGYEEYTEVSYRKKPKNKDDRQPYLRIKTCYR